MSTLIHPNSQPGKTQIALISFLLFSALPLQLQKQFTGYHLAQLCSLFCLHSAVSGPGPSRCRWLTHNWDRWMMRPMGCISREGIQAHLLVWVFCRSSSAPLIIQMFEIPEPVRQGEGAEPRCRKKWTEVITGKDTQVEMRTHHSKSLTQPYVMKKYSNLSNRP